MTNKNLEEYFANLNSHLSAKELAGNLFNPKDLVIGAKDICFRIALSNKSYLGVRELSEWKQASLTDIVNSKELPKEFQMAGCQGVEQDDGATVHIFRDKLYVTTVRRALLYLELKREAKDYLRGKNPPVKVPVYHLDGEITYQPQMQKERPNILTCDNEGELR